MAKPCKHGTAMRLWDRTRLWLNEYLALDVYPRQPDGELPPHDAPALTARATPAVASLRAPSAASVLASRLVPATPQIIPTFAVGDQIADIYDVRQLISRSDFNTVYLAHHVHWNIDLIVKAPSPQLGAVPRAVQQVALRAEEWANIGVHPNITACYYVHSLNGIPLRIIEYVGGGTLRTWLQQRRGPDLRVTLDLAVQICHGIQHAHSRGVAHGHLTLENVLITAQGVPKITDFGVRMTNGPALQSSDSGAGLALRDDREVLMTTWRLMQAPAYVAPERWHNIRAIDAQTDIFALGVCLYELFTGELPYVSTGGPQFPPQPPVASDGQPLPDKLTALLRRCVDWRREWRPRTVDEIGADLGAVYESLFGDISDKADQSAEADEWNNKAVSYFYAGQRSEADAAWEYALSADPRHVDALFNFGVARWREGTLTDDVLVQQLEAASTRRDDRWKVRYFLALIHLERGDRAAALALLEQAARDHPGQAEVQSVLQIVSGRSGTGARGQEVLAGHMGYVSAVCIRADGRVGLSASHDQTAVVWDLTTGRRLHVLQGHSAPLSCAFLSADGQWALTGSDDQTMRLWDLTTAACERVIEGNAGRIFSACLSADGRLLLWAGNLSSEHVEHITVELSDAVSGRRIRSFEGHSSAVKSLALSADGRRAITASDDKTVRLWDVNSGECLRVFAGHQHFVSAVCFDATGNRILSGSWDQTLRLWDAESGNCLRTFTGHKALVTSVCLSADGRWALSGSFDCTVRLWDTATGRCLRTFQGHTSLVTAVALSADNRSALSGGWDCSVRFWELPAKVEEFCRLRLSTSVAAADAPQATK